ncbi:TIGR02587 family membrane protein [uncultured Brevundimonas sp.]|uniref:TIGR02587 family membrane protein n=1 Tax=uncultured Brevundimonas sp. TaxID=213418 RepID=UPI002623FCF1|nr:TIGR02587 family membrane protein [uncultured Brevundimonas sp.]
MRPLHWTSCESESAYLRDLGRAFGGALLFALPLLMTMEMWELGMVLEPWRLLLCLLAGLPILYGLSHYAGFSDRSGPVLNLLDTLGAVFVGAITACGLMLLFNVLEVDNLRIATGQMTLQIVPAAMGALVARKQLSSGRGDKVKKGDYVGELFLMAAGALYLGLNLAPTEEMRLIAYRIGPLAGLGIMALSLVLLHLIVFEVGFAGQEEKSSPMGALMHFTVPGYALCLLISAGILGLFGSQDGHEMAAMATNTVVLAFPASLGAAAARLLV